MADDPLAAMLAALDKTTRERRARAARTPDMNNPYASPPMRAERRTARPYRDPVGEQAIGNIKKEKKS